MLDFLYIAVSWVLLRWHDLFTWLGLDKDGGLNWSLSIVFLVVTARLLLFRLFIKQVHYQRHMQEMSPKIQALREKYKNDRAEMQRQMMKLQQEQGFNPLSGCLPMFLQIPVFLGLFHVLRHLANSVDLPLDDPKLSLYGFTPEETLSAARADLFGAPLAASLRDGADLIVDQLGGDMTTSRVVTIVLVILSAAATFGTQKLAMSRAVTAPTGTAATIQRVMLIVIPLSVLFSGLIFPLGVLLYWFTSNFWTMLQQLYINKYHPHTPKSAPVAGELGKTLAPKPGQRPVRDKGKAATVKASETVEATDSSDTPPAPARPSTPRPGQRPNRPGGNRPPGKRPSQAKKRR